MALDFRILGPLEVADDDVVLRLGGRMERTVLAALLLHAGRVVPVEQLVDDLYGDAAPATAVSQVRDHVSQLRKRFGRKSAILETRAPGYVLRVEPLQLDTVRFERAVEAAVAALGDGRADEARRGAFEMPWRCGGARRSPTSRARNSRRRKSAGSTSSGSRRPSSASPQTSPSATTPRSSRSFRRSFGRIRFASGCVRS